MLRRLFVLILCAAAAYFAWTLIPGTAFDRAIFSLTSRTFANPPFFITGSGTHSSPYTLRTMKSSPGSSPEKLPTVVSLGDDPDGFFQSSPHSPVDFAIILKNFGRLGERGPAIAIPLAWQETDAISLAALDQQLDALPSVITTAPLTRNPIPSTMPPAFRRASVPISGIKGDTALLPVVNRIPIPDIILGKNSSLAGFAFLESEPESETPHLLARWDDSIVFSFPLLIAMQHFQVLPSAIDIRLGEFIALGNSGTFIPIDKHGRLAFSPESIKDSGSIKAPVLIDAPADLLSKNPLPPAILRNDLSSSDQRTRQFSESLVSIVCSLTNPTLTSSSQTFPRLRTPIELSILGSLVFLMAALARHPFARNPLTFLLAACSIAAVHFSAAPLSGIWLPTLPAFASLGAFALVSAISAPVSKKQSPPSPHTVPESTESASQLKTPVKKTAAKKSKTKKITKKSAKKSTRKSTRKTAKKAAKKKTKKTAKKTTQKSAKKAARKTPSKKAPPKSTGE